MVKLNTYSITSGIFLFYLARISSFLTVFMQISVKNWVLNTKFIKRSTKYTQTKINDFLKKPGPRCQFISPYYKISYVCINRICYKIIRKGNVWTSCLIFVHICPWLDEGFCLVVSWTCWAKVNICPPGGKSENPLLASTHFR